jgi:anti-sigma B factor antagonist
MHLAEVHQGKTVTFSISGNLDATTCIEVRDRFEEAVATTPESVLLDLSELRLIDSSGVGAIVSLFKRVRGAGGEFRIKGVNGQPLAIFKVLRLDKVFQLSEPRDSKVPAGKRAPPLAGLELGSASEPEIPRP